MIKKVKKTDWQAQTQEYLASWQRVSADFENYKKYVEENRALWREMAKIDFITKLLPIMDNLRRAKEHLPAELEQNDWAKGVIQIEQQFQNILTEEGLEKITTAKQPFNHELHEALAYEPNPHIKKDFIIDEIESGYKLGDKIIKHAKVRVSSGVK